MEAAVVLPVVILAVLTLGFVLRADSIWEGCMHRVYDECAYSQAEAGNGISRITSAGRIYKSNNDKAGISFTMTGCVFDYSDEEHTNLNRMTARLFVNLKLPLELGRNHKYTETVKYRDFVGLKYERDSLGAEGLETDASSRPVWIFPQSGTKYHIESCTHVKVAVHPCILTESVRNKYDACEMCGSADIVRGSIVYCFDGEDTCYHRGSCRSINRHTIVIDKSEAEKKGYEPCSKCGG